MVRVDNLVLIVIKQEGIKCIYRFTSPIVFFMIFRRGCTGDQSSINYPHTFLKERFDAKLGLCMNPLRSIGPPHIPLLVLKDGIRILVGIEVNTS